MSDKKENAMSDESRKVETPQNGAPLDMCQDARRSVTLCSCGKPAANKYCCAARRRLTARVQLHSRTATGLRMLARRDGTTRIGVAGATATSRLMAGKVATQ